VQFSSLFSSISLKSSDTCFILLGSIAYCGLVWLIGSIAATAANCLPHEIPPDSGV
jgi:hypothetical protein